jgi:hypothetical protein
MDLNYLLKPLMSVFLLAIFPFTVSNAQVASITVDLRDYCGDIIEENVEVSLLDSNGQTLQTSHIFPAIFDGLESGKDYQIKMQVSQPKVNVRRAIDFVAMRFFVSGLFPQTKSSAIRLASDMNDNFSITAIDLLLMAKYYLGFEDVNPNMDGWNFIKTSELNFENVSVFPELNNFRMTQIPEGNQLLEITGIKNGDVISNVDEYCSQCPKENMEIEFVLSYRDTFLKAGEKYLIDLSITAEESFTAAAFGLETRNLKIENIHANQTHVDFRIFDDKSRINFMSWMGIPANLGSEELRLEVFATEDGFLRDMLFLSDDFSHQGVFYQNNCLLWSKSAKVDQISQFNPDCKVIWPANTTLANCQTGVYAGVPLIPTECNDFYTLTYSDNTNENCTQTLRTYTGYNLIENKTESHVQRIDFNPQHEFLCKEKVEIFLADNQSIDLTPQDLMVRALEGHLLSFDPGGNITAIEISNFSNDTHLSVHNLTTQEVCYSYLRILCSLSPEDYFYDSLIYSDITGNEFKLEARNFYFGEAQLCQSEVRVRISADGELFYDALIFDMSQASRWIPLYLNYNWNNEVIQYGTVYVYFDKKSEDFQPLIFSVENTELKAGEVNELSVRVKNFQDITSFQFGLISENASFNGLSNRHELLNSLGLNLSEAAVKLSWFDALGEPNDLENGEVIFNLLVTPDFPGFVSEFIRLDEEFPIEATALFPGNVYTEKIGFRFEIAETTSRTFENGFMDIAVWPNPVVRGGQISFHIPESLQNTGGFILTWTDGSGRIMARTNYSDQMIHSLGSSYTIPEFIPAGVYFLSIGNAQNSTTRKILIME